MHPYLTGAIRSPLQRRPCGYPSRDISSSIMARVRAMSSSFLADSTS
jgi:hypothetical protein